MMEGRELRSVQERLVWAPPDLVYRTLRASGGRLAAPDSSQRVGTGVFLAGDTALQQAEHRKVGDRIGAWRISSLKRSEEIELVRERILAGSARLRWQIEPRAGGRSLLRQTISITPVGGVGRALWGLGRLAMRVYATRLLHDCGNQAERLGNGPPTGRPQRGLRLLRRETVVPVPLEQAFAFFSDAANLQRLTPPWVSFRILTPMPLELTKGSRIDYRIRIRGIGVGWRTEITAWQPPMRFVDVQLRGPYRWWHHEHRFEQCDEGTRVIDEVEYAAPLGWISEPLVVRQDVERIFDYREKALHQVFRAEDATGSPRDSLTAAAR